MTIFAILEQNVARNITFGKIVQSDPLFRAPVMLQSTCNVATTLSKCCVNVATTLLQRYRCTNPYYFCPKIAFATLPKRCQNVAATLSKRCCNVICILSLNYRFPKVAYAMLMQRTCNVDTTLPKTLSQRCSNVAAT